MWLCNSSKSPKLFYCRSLFLVPLSVCRSVSISLSLSLCLPLCLSLFPPYLYLCLFVCPSVTVSVTPSISLSLISLSLSVYLSVCLTVSLAGCWFIRASHFLSMNLILQIFMSVLLSRRRESNISIGKPFASERRSWEEAGPGPHGRLVTVRDPSVDYKR